MCIEGRQQPTLCSLFSAVDQLPTTLQSAVSLRRAHRRWCVRGVKGPGKESDQRVVGNRTVMTASTAFAGFAKRYSAKYVQTGRSVANQLCCKLTQLHPQWHLPYYEPLLWAECLTERRQECIYLEYAQAWNDDCVAWIAECELRSPKRGSDTPRFLPKVIFVGFLFLFLFVRWSRLFPDHNGTPPSLAVSKEC